MYIEIIRINSTFLRPPKMQMIPGYAQTVQCPYQFFPACSKIQQCATAGCHDNLKDKKGTNSLYYVMHAKEKADAPLKHQSCLSCHVKVVAEKPDLKKDLTGCAKSKCHP